MANYFKYQDLNIDKMAIFKSETSDADRAKMLKTYFDNAGLDTSLQTFSYYRGNRIISGTNVHGIFRAPRGEGTEALVLMAPQYVNDTCKL